MQYTTDGDHACLHHLFSSMISMTWLKERSCLQHGTRIILVCIREKSIFLVSLNCWSQGSIENRVYRSSKQICLFAQSRSRFDQNISAVNLAASLSPQTRTHDALHNICMDNVPNQPFYLFLTVRISPSTELRNPIGLLDDIKARTFTDRLKSRSMSIATLAIVTLCVLSAQAADPIPGVVFSAVARNVHSAPIDCTISWGTYSLAAVPDESITIPSGQRTVIQEKNVNMGTWMAVAFIEAIRCGDGKLIAPFPKVTRTQRCWQFQVEPHQIISLGPGSCT